LKLLLDTYKCLPKESRDKAQVRALVTWHSCDTCPRLTLSNLDSTNDIPYWASEYNQNLRSSETWLRLLLEIIQSAIRERWSSASEKFLHGWQISV